MPNQPITKAERDKERKAITLELFLLPSKPSKEKEGLKWIELLKEVVNDLKKQTRQEKIDYYYSILLLQIRSFFIGKDLSDAMKEALSDLNEYHDFQIKILNSLKKELKKVRKLKRYEELLIIYSVLELISTLKENINLKISEETGIIAKEANGITVILPEKGYVEPSTIKEEITYRVKELNKNNPQN